MLKPSNTHSVCFKQILLQHTCCVFNSSPVVILAECSFHNIAQHQHWGHYTVSFTQPRKPFCVRKSELYGVQKIACIIFFNRICKKYRWQQKHVLRYSPNYIQTLILLLRSFSLSCFNQCCCSTSCLKSFIKLDYAAQQCGKLRKHMSSVMFEEFWSHVWHVTCCWKGEPQSIIFAGQGRGGAGAVMHFTLPFCDSATWNGWQEVISCRRSSLGSCHNASVVCVMSILFLSKWETDKRVYLDKVPKNVVLIN